MAQWAQLQPQEDLPFFLSLTNETTIPDTIAAKTIITAAVPSHDIIIDSFHVKFRFSL